MPSTTAAMLLATICVLDAGDAKEAAARMREYSEDVRIIAASELTLDLLDAPLTVDNWYQAGETVTRVREHPLTEGLDGRGLPFPHDRIISFENGPWKALARGVSSGDDSLLVGEFTRGRAVVWAGNPNVANGEGILLSRVVTWLATSASDPDVR